jgi:hypothetical protein
MYKLKLFEDFENYKSFKDIGYYYFNDKEPICIDEHALGDRVINLIQKKLGDKYHVLKNDDTLFIYSGLKPFLWKVIFFEDDYFLVKRSFLLNDLHSTVMYFECDGVRGIYELIDPTYTFHTLYEQSDMKIWEEDNSVRDTSKGSNWINLPSFLSPEGECLFDLKKINPYLPKESYPINEVQNMLNTLKKKKFKVSKSNLYEIPKDTLDSGIEESGYEVFKITLDDDKDFIILYYYVRAFNMFCVLKVDKYVYSYRCWDIKGLKSLLSSI